MKQNYAPSLVAVLKHEGGYVNDPQDNGGATNRGVTQAVYDDWRISHGQARRSVRSLAPAEIDGIYRQLYWNTISGDSLPSGIDYATFDFAVNSGPHRAARFLQATVDVLQDGQIGAITVQALVNADHLAVIDELCDNRLKYLEQLPDWAHFGHGWATRVADVREIAKALAS